MQLVTVTDIYRRKYLVSAIDLAGSRIQLPLYCKTGRKVAHIPKGLRPDCITIHRSNIVNEADIERLLQEQMVRLESLVQQRGL